MSFAHGQDGDTGKVERDEATEPADATGHPPGQDDAGSGESSEDPAEGDAPTEDPDSDPGPEPEPTVAPPAMTPLEVAQAGPAAAVRVHCDARCGQEWCLYAGSDFPADDAGEPYPDPREVVMAAAGCHADPPTCPGAVDTTRPGGSESPSASSPAALSPATPEGRAAMVAATTTPDLIAAGQLRTIRGPGTLAERLGAAGDAPTAANVQPLRAPIPLTTAEAHGLTEGNAPDPNALPYATGLGVLDALRSLGIEAGALKDVIVAATPDPELGDGSRPENPDPAE